MSSAKLKVIENHRFVSRLIEACGADRPADLQRSLNISYQAAKNYLRGRLPNTEMLMIISEQTGVSIDWLLTGRGAKLVTERQAAGTHLPPGREDAFVRKVCMEVINERFGESVSPKVVVLQPEDVRSETVEENVAVTSDREP
jgi:hypothetical protein